MEYFAQAEIWDSEKIAHTQLTRLRLSMEQAVKSPFYKKHFSAAEVTPYDIRTLDDIRKVPFTTKEDLRGAYPFGLITVPQHELVRLHASSGTTGTPTVICHTQADLNIWADLMARCMYMVGIRNTDIFQNMSGYGLFTGGLGIHSGAERLGCLTIPAGAGNTRRQLKLINDLNVTVLHILPSYALYLGSILLKEGIDPRSMSPRIALIGAEPHTDEVRRRIEDLLDVKAYNSYGLSEMNGPGVAFECREQNGLHVWEDAYIAEIIDPKTGFPVAEGEIGELVMTTLTRRGMPIIRYRTRDLTRFISGDCPCGRKHKRIDRIHGRVDDLFIIKGCNIYPMQIEQTLMTFPEVGENYLIILDQHNGIDQLHIQVEIRPECFVADMRILQDLQTAIAHRIRDEVLVTPKVELVPQNFLPQSEGKAVRVEDRRPPLI